MQGFIISLTTQQRFKNEIDNVALISNDDKIIQSIHSIVTYAFGISRSKKDLESEKEDITSSNIIKR